MRTFAIAVLLSVAGVCVGQQPMQTKPPICVNEGARDPRCIPQPSPIKCGKYEHDMNIFDECHGDPENGGIAICTHTPRCEPDLHTVTEREWQEMMERLKKLEKQIRGEGGPTF